MLRYVPEGGGGILTLILLIVDIGEGNLASFRTGQGI